METVHSKCHATLTPSTVAWCTVYYNTQWQVEAVSWYTCICTHISSFTLSLWRRIKYLMTYVFVSIYFVPFIATFKGHGQTSEVFLEFYFSLTLVKHILWVCLPEIFIVAFPCLWSPSCSVGVFTFLRVYLF